MSVRERLVTNTRASFARSRILVVVVVAVGLVVAACDDSDGGSADGGSGSTTTTSLPPCERESRPVVEPSGSSAHGELLTDVSVEPGPHSVVTGVVKATTARPATVRVVATARTSEVEAPATASGRDHEVALLGMTAEAAYDVAVTATAEDGSQETVDLTFESGSLPENLPPVEATVSEPDRMAPGVTLLNTLAWGPGNAARCEPPGGGGGWIIGVGDTGDVVWYYRSTLEIADVSATPRGTLLVSVRDVVVREIDMLGNTLSELGTRVATDYAPEDLSGRRHVSDVTVPIDIDSAHHELTELSNGNLLTLSTEIVTFDPEEVDGLCHGKEDADGKAIPDPPGVVADVVVEMTRTGEVVHTWPLTDYFDPLERPGSDLCTIGAAVAPPNWFYPEREDLRDWTHANAATIDEETNTLLVSIRHLDAVIGIRYADDASGPGGELKWVLSPHEGTLELDGDFSYHGHAVEPQPGGRILYYDNGNGRPKTAGGEPSFSRAVIYEIDEAAGTAREVWEHRDVTPEGPPMFTPFLSDADMQPNGNILITHGGAGTKDGVFYSRIVEVDRGSDGNGNTVVFDLTLGDRETMGYTAYRADRIASLYTGSATG